MSEELLIFPENQNDEKKIFEKICECIKNKRSFIFDAGAGAGKTYELLQALKYIINTYGFLLNKHNQKILCITYTNVAVEEIKNRLGNSKIVVASTIHECLWDIISPYQEQLVKIHQKNMEEIKDKITNDLNVENWASNYRNLGKDKQVIFFELINDKKEIYNKHYNENAASFRVAMQEIININDFPNILRNINDFKKIVNNLLKRIRYQQTIEKIKANEKKYQSIDYDSRRNIDKLESMKISHDTLLDYAEKIVEQNQLLRRFIADKYPYVLVDEYQDTNEKVIKLLKHVYNFAIEKHRDFFLAFFGDAKQNIYEDGIGRKIKEYVTSFERIIKSFNRRSASEIIAIANKIRDDDVKQKTIYSNFPKANISFYNINEDTESEDIKDKLISKYSEEWNINAENKLHCFELRNESVAKRSRFHEIYEFFQTSNFYRKAENYKYLSQHVLGKDSKKRGEAQNTILQVLDFKAKITNNEIILAEIIPKEVSKQININELRNLIKKLKTIKGNTLTELVTSLFSLYGNNDQIFNKCIDSIFGEFKSIKKYEEFFLNELFLHDEELSDEDRQADIIKVKDFFNLQISIFESWYNYLFDKDVGDIVFHTFHSTKGLEFDNVLIFFESNFARNRNYFNNLFYYLNNGSINGEKNDIESARNLLYVALTRAKHNLSILYLSDLGENIDIAKNIFGEIIAKI